MEEPDFVTAVENEVLSYRSETNPYDQKKPGNAIDINFSLAVARSLAFHVLPQRVLVE